MRKIILLTIAAIITFGVFAKNPPSASAPNDGVNPEVSVESAIPPVQPDSAKVSAAENEAKAAAQQPENPANAAKIQNDQVAEAPLTAAVPEKAATAPQLSEFAATSVADEPLFAAAHTLINSRPDFGERPGLAASDKPSGDIERIQTVSYESERVADSGFLTATRKLGGGFRKTSGADRTRNVSVRKAASVESESSLASLGLAVIKNISPAVSKSPRSFERMPGTVLPMPMVERTRPAAASVEPTEVSRKPAGTSTKPIAAGPTATALRTKPALLAAKPAASATKPIAASPKPAAVRTKTAAPATKPIAASSKPAAVRTKTAAPARKPIAASPKPAAVRTKTAAPARKPIAASPKPAAVRTKTAAPATKPIAASPRPAVVRTKTAAPATKPIAASPKPAVVSTKTAAPATKPIAASPKPVVLTTKPAASAAKPILARSSPSILERKPIVTESRPNPLIPNRAAIDQKLLSGSLLDRAQNRFLRLNISGWKTTADPPKELVSAKQKVDGSYCDKDFVGEPIAFSQTAELTLDDLLFQIHNRFGINFLMGDGIANMPINIKTGSIPWNSLLASQLFVSGVRASCISPNTIQLVRNDALPKLQSAVEVKPTFIKLKYLQPTSGGNVDIAGRSSGRGGASGSGRSGGQSGCDSGSGGGGGGAGGGSQNCGPFEKLIIEIEKILGIRSQTQSSVGGGGGGFGGGGGGGTQAQATEPIKTNRQVSQVPGRSMLFVRATDDELALINEIVSRADRAPFQVIIRGLVYTANENKLRDIGIQTSIFAQKADGTTSGGIFGQPVPSSGTLFDFSSLVGTVEFNATANALAQNGVISIKSRPFTTVLDGDTADLDVGRQIPVLVQALNSVGGVPGTLEILDAGNILSVTPFVLDDENGKPIGVNLTIQLESNDVDTSVTSQGVPSVNRRSIQTRMILNQEKTVILGGFTVDSDSRNVTKTPGLGDIPILGNLFKRKVRSSELNRLYFAISVEIMTYPKVVSPTNVPGTNTDIPSVTPEMKKRSDEAEPKQVVGPPPAKDDGP